MYCQSAAVLKIASYLHLRGGALREVEKSSSSSTATLSIPPRAPLPNIRLTLKTRVKKHPYGAKILRSSDVHGVHWRRPTDRPPYAQSCWWARGRLVLEVRRNCHNQAPRAHKIVHPRPLRLWRSYAPPYPPRPSSVHRQKMGRGRILLFSAAHCL